MTLMYNSVEYNMCIVVEMLLKSFVPIMAVLNIIIIIIIIIAFILLKRNRLAES